MESKKISIILPNLRGGGAERIAIYLANDWSSRGYLVEFILMQSQCELLHLLSPDIPIVSMGVDRIRKLIKPLKKHLRISKPDIIVAGMWPLTSAVVLAWLLAFRPGRLYLIEHCHLSAECARGLHFSSFYLKFLMRLTYPFATGIIAVSNGVKEDLRRLGKFSDDQIQVIHNPAATGISAHRSSIKDREILWGKGFDYHILTVGNLKVEKNHEGLIRAFAKLVVSFNAKLTIVGDGSLRNQIENLVENYGLQDRVHLAGFVHNVYPWYRSADLFVLSSVSEGLPTVLIEAMECGVPIVSTRCNGGPEEILGDGVYGRLVSDDDESELINAIGESLIGQHDSQELIKRANDFSINRISDQYLYYFQLSESSSIKNI